MSVLDRRDFLKGSLAAAVTVGAGISSDKSAAVEVSRAQEVPTDSAVDTNVNLSRWPFRRLRGDTPNDLVEILQSHNVTQAWAGSYDGLLHKNITAVNNRLAEKCAGEEVLVPIGSINPRLPDWEEDLRRCDEVHGMPGIRLHPNYHQYAVGDTVFARVIEEAADRGMIVQLPVVMEDERTQHPLVQVPVVDVSPLPDLVRGISDVTVVLQNSRGNVPGDVLGELVDTGRVYVDIARAEGVGAVSSVLEQVPADRVLFGSHAPYFYHTAAHMKMKESDLSDEVRRSIYRSNAEQLLNRG